MKYGRIIAGSFGAMSMAMAFCSYAQNGSNAFETGFYAAGKVGTEEIRANMDVITTLDAINTVPPFNGHTDQVLEDVHVYDNYVMGNLALGGNFVFGRFLAGLEISANISGEEEVSINEAEVTNIAFGTFPISRSSLTSEYAVEFTDPDLIADFRPGFLIAPNFLVYGRVGAAYNQVETEIETVYTVSELGTLLTDHVTVNDSDKEDVVGLRLGLGVEYKITDRFGVNLDYVYTDYGTIDHDVLATDTLAIGALPLLGVSSATDVETELAKQTFTVGGTVYFGPGCCRKAQPAPVYYGPDK